MKGWRFTDKWTSSCVYTPILRDVAVVRSSSEIVHHKYPCMSVCAWVCVLKVNIVVVKAQCLLNKGGDSSTGKSSRQLFSAESCCVSTEGDIMRGGGDNKQTITSAAGENSCFMLDFLLWQWSSFGTLKTDALIQILSDGWWSCLWSWWHCWPWPSPGPAPPSSAPWLAAIRRAWRSHYWFALRERGQRQKGNVRNELQETLLHTVEETRGSVPGYTTSSK